jgi:hypothetical protein
MKKILHSGSKHFRGLDDLPLEVTVGSEINSEN